MEPLDSPEIAYGDTTFYIGKMLPLEAKGAFMRDVRPLFRGALSGEIADNSNGWKAILAAFTDAPQAHYDALTKTLYRHIRYCRDGEPVQPLAGDEERAFEGMDMVNILDLDVRSFMRNFLGSWDALQRMYPVLGSISALLPSLTPTPSSTTQSPPGSSPPPS